MTTAHRTALPSTVAGGSAYRARPTPMAARHRQAGVTIPEACLLIAAVTIPLGLALLADDRWLPRGDRRVAAPEWPAGAAQGIS